ncbi:MAG TPA: hypothetical protein VM008_06055 [Phycisphaerae bacterium]|nr:hypothetical protein [Phycisphaerae bacterium]
MGRLLNIRLSKQDAAVVDQLRRKGVVVSDLVRVALRDEYAKQQDAPPSSPADLLEWLHRKYPAPASQTTRRIDATNRKKVAAFLRDRLKKRSGKRKVA